MKLGVTGTRDGFSEAQLAWAANWVVDNGDLVSEFHYGDCVGVDEQMLWVLLFNIVQEPALFIYPASVSDKWKAKTFDRLMSMEYKGLITRYVPLPPLVRNGYIAENCDYLLAFPGSGRGTWDCIRKAQALERRGYVVLADGEVKIL